MKIVVNGDKREVADSVLLLDLLNSLELRPEMTVVERNGQIVEAEAFQTTRLAEDDVLELVRFVGGG